VFENAVQRGIVGPKNDTAYWYNLCAGEMHNLCVSSSVFDRSRREK
jgi:hypothetical protein